jgi:hypothetical protein
MLKCCNSTKKICNECLECLTNRNGLKQLAREITNQVNESNVNKSILNSNDISEDIFEFEF